MTAMTRKNPTLAGILSGVMPGLGQFYCREWKKGAAFLAGALIMDAGLGVSASFLELLQGGRATLTVNGASGILLRSLPFWH